MFPPQGFEPGSLDAVSRCLIHYAGTPYDSMFQDKNTKNRTFGSKLKKNLAFCLIKAPEKKVTIPGALPNGGPWTNIVED